MNRLFNRLLSRSNSYNYYKSNYEILKSQLNTYKAEMDEFQNIIKKISNDLKVIHETQNELLNMKNTTESSLNSLQETQNDHKKTYNEIINQISSIKIQQNITSIKQDVKNGKIINIVFIINFRIAAVDTLISLFEKDPQFNPVILIIPYDTYGIDIFDKGLNKHQLQEYEDNYEYFKRKGFNVIKGYNHKLKALIDIESQIKPDIIFYSTPWENSFPKQFRIENLPGNVIFCYIPYGIHSSYNVNAQFNFKLQKKSWKIFYPTQIHKELAAKYSDTGSSNAVVTGYPKMDPVINGSHEKAPYTWKDPSHLKKRVIWAPHHSMNHYIRFSTFDKNYEFFYNFAKDNSNIEWVFKPHPNLRHHYLISSEYFDDDRFNKESIECYFSKWDNLPNATVYEGGDYLNMFVTSDAMITDSSSFLSEYIYSGNPGLFLTNSTQRFNEYGEIIKKAWYQIDGTNFKEIENFINDVVINGEDPLKTTRENIYNRYIKTNGLASEKIYNYIKSNLTVENEHYAD